MVARIAVFDQQPDRFTEGRYRWVLDAIRNADGFLAAYHAVDVANGDSISISLFESGDAARAAETKVGAAGAALEIPSSPPDEVRLCRVVDAA